MPKKYQEDPKLGTWVETQRNLWNREYKQTKPTRTDSGSSSNEDVPPPPAAAAMSPVRAKSPEEWADEMEKAATINADAAMAVNIDGGGVEAAAMEVVNEVTAHAGDGNPAAVVEGKDVQGEVEDGKLPPKRLTQDRKEMLDLLGFVWSLRSKRTEDHWDDMYRQLVEYKEKHGVSTLSLVQQDMNPILFHFSRYLSRVSSLDRTVSFPPDMKET